MAARPLPSTAPAGRGRRATGSTSTRLTSRAPPRASGCCSPTGVDTPLGDGWLLANRIAASQALAEPFVDLGVRRLASTYAAFQDHLDQMMGWDGRMALLTAGEADPRFFSHAYFARYMSAALIEPADLTVREGAAYVKTLDGLKRVDVLLRGVPDAGVDALHRPGRAVFGAPALSLAARSGSLKIANAIGSRRLRLPRARPIRAPARDVPARRRAAPGRRALPLARHSPARASRCWPSATAGASSP